MLRVTSIGIAVGAITAALIIPQWIAVALRLPARRLIPIVYHRAICRLLGVRIRVIGKAQRGPVLLVANHVSWLDICVLTALAPMVFVAKREVATWPLFGLLARLQRSVFVDRMRPHKTVDTNAEIASRLAEGDPVVLFAEGTSSDGNRVLPFRSSLIGAARTALEIGQSKGTVAIQPLAIVYTAIDGLPVGRQHAPYIAWYGAMDLLPHLAGIIRRGAIDVTVSFGEPQALDHAADRKAMARTMETAVREMREKALQRTRQPKLPSS
jgi:1-acyl-sn-glycerol-3-phosphate acyltransferase